MMTASWSPWASAIVCGAAVAALAIAPPAADSRRAPTPSERVSIVTSVEGLSQTRFPARCATIYVSTVDIHWSSLDSGPCAPFDGFFLLHRRGNRWVKVTSGSDRSFVCPLPASVPRGVARDLLITCGHIHRTGVQAMGLGRIAIGTDSMGPIHLGQSRHQVERLLGPPIPDHWTLRDHQMNLHVYRGRVSRIELAGSPALLILAGVSLTRGPIADGASGIRSCPFYGNTSIQATRNVSCKAALRLINHAYSERCTSHRTCRVDGYSCRTISPIPGDIRGSFQTTCKREHRKVIFASAP